MSGRKLFDRDYDRLAAMREEGKSYEQIARVFGCSAKAISWHCLRLGAEPPKPAPLRLNYHLEHPVMKRGNHIVRAFTPEEDARLLQLEAQGLGYIAMGKAIGRKQNSVRGRLMTLARREARAEQSA